MSRLLLKLRRNLRVAARPTTHVTRRWINYGHDMHKVLSLLLFALYLDVGEVLNLRMLRIYDQDMLNGTAKVSVMEYDEGGFVINDVNMRGGIALFSEIAMVKLPTRRLFIHFM
uniref:Uncharacterized protein n=1 Tax=Hyaloperonospora arabidopsidis (strain Emoy2) TaxID=559515 RepID=M4BV33_HYAAE